MDTTNRARVGDTMPNQTDFAGSTVPPVTTAPCALPLPVNKTIVGDLRKELSYYAAYLYDRGASIRDIATAWNRSYGWVHRLLKEAGVTLRTRGGSLPGRPHSTTKVHDIGQDFGQALRNLSRAMTIRELSEKTGIGTETLYKYYRGDSVPNYDYLTKILDVLKVNDQTRAAIGRKWQSARKAKLRRYRILS